LSKKVTTAGVDELFQRGDELRKEVAEEAAKKKKPHYHRRKTKSLQLDLDKDLHTQFKAMCPDGMMSWIVRELIRAYVVRGGIEGLITECTRGTAAVNAGKTARRPRGKRHSCVGLSRILASLSSGCHIFRT
jgi:hypothetical protein